MTRDAALPLPPAPALALALAHAPTRLFYSTDPGRLILDFGCPDNAQLA